MALLQPNYSLLRALLTTILISMATAETSHHNLFASDIFKAIATDRAQNNVVFSPASIQSCLALAYLGAEGETAQQMHKALRLPTNLDKAGIAENYATFIRNRFIAKQSDKADAPKLRLANRIYVNDLLKISAQYNELAKKSFDTEAVPTQFNDSIHAAESINTWVENQTEGKIRNLIQPGTLTTATSAILVNAIYFKGKWLKPFSERSTTNTEFKMAGGKRTMVPMMYGDERLKYGDLQNLDASVIVLPYKDSDLSMMILLPNKDEGLQELEQKLALTDLNQIDSQLRMEHVDVLLPKFRIEFDIDLKEPLRKVVYYYTASQKNVLRSGAKENAFECTYFEVMNQNPPSELKLWVQLGLTEMFSDSADFSSLFAEKQPQKIDEVKHNAFIDVNEAGSEAAAATFIKIVPMSLNLDQKAFRADHPFVFAIRDQEAIYFMGHVTKF